MDKFVKKLSRRLLSGDQLQELLEMKLQKGSNGVAWVEVVKPLLNKAADADSRVLFDNVFNIVKIYLVLSVQHGLKHPKKCGLKYFQVFNSLMTHCSYSTEDTDLPAADVKRLIVMVLAAVIDMIAVTAKSGEENAAVAKIFMKLTMIFGHSQEHLLDALLQCRTLIFPSLRRPQVFVPLIKRLFSSFKRKQVLNPQLYLKYLLLGKLWLFMSKKEEVGRTRMYVIKMLEPPRNFTEWAEQQEEQWLNLPRCSTRHILKAMTLKSALKNLLGTSSETLHGSRRKGSKKPANATPEKNQPGPSKCSVNNEKKKKNKTQTNDSRCKTKAGEKFSIPQTLKGERDKRKTKSRPATDTEGIEREAAHCEVRGKAKQKVVEEKCVNIAKYKTKKKKPHYPEEETRIIPEAAQANKGKRSRQNTKSFESKPKKMKIENCNTELIDTTGQEGSKVSSATMTWKTLDPSKYSVNNKKKIVLQGHDIKTTLEAQKRFNVPQTLSIIGKEGGPIQNLCVESRENTSSQITKKVKQKSEKKLANTSKRKAQKQLKGPQREDVDRAETVHASESKRKWQEVELEVLTPEKKTANKNAKRGKSTADEKFSTNREGIDNKKSIDLCTSVVHEVETVSLPESVALSKRAKKKLRRKSRQACKTPPAEMLRDSPLCQEASKGKESKKLPACPSPQAFEVTPSAASSTPVTPRERRRSLRMGEVSEAQQRIRRNSLTFIVTDLEFDGSMNSGQGEGEGIGSSDEHSLLEKSNIVGVGRSVSREQKSRIGSWQLNVPHQKHTSEKAKSAFKASRYRNYEVGEKSEGNIDEGEGDESNSDESCDLESSNVNASLQSIGDDEEERVGDNSDEYSYEKHDGDSIYDDAWRDITDDSSEELEESDDLMVPKIGGKAHRGKSDNIKKRQKLIPASVHEKAHSSGERSDLNWESNQNKMKEVVSAGEINQTRKLLTKSKKRRKFYDNIKEKGNGKTVAENIAEREEIDIEQLPNEISNSNHSVKPTISEEPVNVASGTTFTVQKEVEPFQEFKEVEEEYGATNHRKDEESRAMMSRGKLMGSKNDYAVDLESDIEVTEEVRVLCGNSSKIESDSDIEIVMEEVTSQQIQRPQHVVDDETELDEASGSDSDIVPCNELSRMFTEEETKKYHDKLRADIIQDKVDRILKEDKKEFDLKRKISETKVKEEEIDPTEYPVNQNDAKKTSKSEDLVSKMMNKLYKSAGKREKKSKKGVVRGPLTPSPPPPPPLIKKDEQKGKTIQKDTSQQHNMPLTKHAEGSRGQPECVEESSGSPQHTRSSSEAESLPVKELPSIPEVENGSATELDTYDEDIEVVLQTIVNDTGRLASIRGLRERMLNMNSVKEEPGESPGQQGGDHWEATKEPFPQKQTQPEDSSKAVEEEAGELQPEETVPLEIIVNDDECPCDHHKLVNGDGGLEEVNEESTDKEGADHMLASPTRNDVTYTACSNNDFNIALALSTSTPTQRERSGACSSLQQVLKAADSDQMENNGESVHHDMKEGPEEESESSDGKHNLTDDAHVKEEVNTSSSVLDVEMLDTISDKSCSKMSEEVCHEQSVHDESTKGSNEVYVGDAVDNVNSESAPTSVREVDSLKNSSSTLEIVIAEKSNIKGVVTDIVKNISDFKPPKSTDIQADNVNSEAPVDGSGVKSTGGADEAYEASSDASEDPTPRTRRRSRSLRRSCSHLEVQQASDSDSSPVRGPFKGSSDTGNAVHQRPRRKRSQSCSIETLSSLPGTIVNLQTNFSTPSANERPVSIKTVMKPNEAGTCLPSHDEKQVTPNETSCDTPINHSVQDVYDKVKSTDSFSQAGEIEPELNNSNQKSSIEATDPGSSNMAAHPSSEVESNLTLANPSLTPSNISNEQTENPDGKHSAVSDFNKESHTPQSEEELSSNDSCHSCQYLNKSKQTETVGEEQNSLATPLCRHLDSSRIPCGPAKEYDAEKDEISNRPPQHGEDESSSRHASASVSLNDSEPCVHKEDQTLDPVQNSTEDNPESLCEMKNSDDRKMQESGDNACVNDEPHQSELGSDCSTVIFLSMNKSKAEGTNGGTHEKERQRSAPAVSVEDKGMAEEIFEGEGEELEVLSTSGIEEEDETVSLSVTPESHSSDDEDGAERVSFLISKKSLRSNLAHHSPTKSGKEKGVDTGNKDGKFISIPPVKAHCVSEVVLTKEILISPEVSDEECELVSPEVTNDQDEAKFSSTEDLENIQQQTPPPICFSNLGLRKSGGGIRSPHKTIPEEQDESTVSRKRSEGSPRTPQAPKAKHSTTAAPLSAGPKEDVLGDKASLSRRHSRSLMDESQSALSPSLEMTRSPKSITKCIKVISKSQEEPSVDSSSKHGLDNPSHTSPEQTSQKLSDTHDDSGEECETCTHSSVPTVESGTQQSSTRCITRNKSQELQSNSPVATPKKKGSDSSSSNNLESSSSFSNDSDGCNSTKNAKTPVANSNILGAIPEGEEDKEVQEVMSSCREEVPGRDASPQHAGKPLLGTTMSQLPSTPVRRSTRLSLQVDTPSPSRGMKNIGSSNNSSDSEQKIPKVETSNTGKKRMMEGGDDVMESPTGPKILRRSSRRASSIRRVLNDFNY